MEIIGTVKTFTDVEEYNNFKKAGVVIETDEKYPQILHVEFYNDSISKLMDKFAVGDVVSVKINIKGREWTSPSGETRYFTSLNGWEISKYISSGGTDGIPRQVLEDEIGQDDMPF